MMIGNIYFSKMKYSNLYFLITLLLTSTKFCSTQQGTINYYIDLLTTSVQEAMNFLLPTNANIYKPKVDTIEDYGTYDFVIIGAGVSGSVIANRLSEITSWKILLIEAGDYSDGGLIQIPGFYQYNNLTKYNWAYTTVPQENICLGDPNQVCQITRGKGVGGGSLINGLVYCRGPPGDYDKIAELMNDSSWNYENVLKYFKKTESFDWNNPEALIDESYHGDVGLLQVELGLPTIAFGEQFLDGIEEMGYKLIDYNGPNMIGSSYFQRFSRSGRREDFGSVFISPFLGRPSLEVTTQSYVIKIEINDVTKIAESVLFTKEGNTYRVKASKEIILSAGTIASPQILMLSGVGPQKHLNDLEIKVIQNLEVGSKMKDHVVYSLPFSSNMKFHQQTLQEELFEYLHSSTGFLTSPLNIPQTVGYFQINESKSGVPDFELFPSVDQDLTGMLKNSVSDQNTSTLSIGTEFYTIKSVGTVRLVSNNPYEYPLIDLKSMSDANNEDMDLLYQSVQFIFKLINTKPYKKYNVQYIDKKIPACAKYVPRSKDYWYCMLKRISYPGLHMVGTCSMGTDPEKGAVVDSKLKVYGIGHLRVADASVFPDLIAGHSTIPCSTLAEKISDDIKREYRKPTYSH